MKRSLISSLVICLALSSIGFADMNRQFWDIAVNENLAGVKAFHEDKRPDMLPFDPAPDTDEVLAESWFGDSTDTYGEPQGAEREREMEVKCGHWRISVGVTKCVGKERIGVARVRNR